MIKTVSRQGFEKAQPRSLGEQAPAGELWAMGSAFAFLAEHRERRFPDSMPKEGFPVRGLAFHPGRGDRHGPGPAGPGRSPGPRGRGAAEALTLDLRWKVACGSGLTQTPFQASSLTHWRKRLAASEHPHRIMGTVFEIVTETRVYAVKRRRSRAGPGRSAD